MPEALIIFGAKYLYFGGVFIVVVFVATREVNERKRLFLVALLSFPLAYVLAKIGSALYFDPRPFTVGNFEPLIAHAADNGFPSDHTLLSAACAALVFASSRKIGGALFALAFLVGASRVLAGVHSWTDILGSLLFAFAAMKITVFLQNKVLAFDKKKTL